MAGSPSWKVYNTEKKYVAAFVRVEDAARFVGGMEGYSIRSGHSVSWTVWSEGSEGQSAAESFDHVAEVAELRCRRFAWQSYVKGCDSEERARESFDKSNGEGAFDRLKATLGDVL